MARTALWLMAIAACLDDISQAQQPAGVCRLSGKRPPPAVYRTIVSDQVGMTRISSPRQTQVRSVPANPQPTPLPIITEIKVPTVPLATAPEETLLLQESVPLLEEAEEIVESFDELNSVQSANHDVPAVINPAPRPLADWNSSIPSSGRQEQIGGTVESIDLANQTAVITLPKQAVAVLASRTFVVHKYTLGRLQAIGEFEVTSTAPGTAVVRPAAGTSIRLFSVGDTARVFIDAAGAY